jgi:hypothetical protein
VFNNFKILFSDTELIAGLVAVSKPLENTTWNFKVFLT